MRMNNLVSNKKMKRKNYFHKSLFKGKMQYTMMISLLSHAYQSLKKIYKKLRKNIFWLNNSNNKMVIRQQNSRKMTIISSLHKKI